MRRLAMTFAMALALPVAATAQGGPPQGRVQQNSIEWLLTQKDQFRPSEEQVAKLAELGKQLTEATSKQRDEMRKLRQENMGGDRAAMMEKVRPIMEQIRKQDSEATEAALKVLNEEQQKVVKDLLDARQKEMQARRRMN